MKPPPDEKGNNVHIGIVGPCSSGPLADLLPSAGGVDLGWGGYPVVNLVRALIRQGHHVSVITLSRMVTEQKILNGPRLTYHVYPMRTRRRTRDLWKFEREGLREGILSAKPDLLHAHWTYEFALASLETGLPTLVTCHDNAFRVLRFNRNLYRLVRLYFQIQVIRRAHFLTAVSPYIANALSWLANTDIEVIPNLIDIPREAVSPTSQALGPLRIATVINGWQNLKNPKAAIEAFNLLLRQRPNAEMFMFGYGFGEGDHAPQWAKSMELSRNIHFCGALPHSELQMELRKMSILLHPALEEACPMAVIEAMALGLPVVAGLNSGGVAWVLDQGRAGFLTDVRNPEKIMQTLVTCVEQAEDREQRKRNAYNRVLNVFSPDSVTSRYEKMYGKVLSPC
jgi:glycosyltransferase involved in cell wall biosynthesis